jgi:hypothetical protein
MKQIRWALFGMAIISGTSKTAGKILETGMALGIWIFSSMDL